MTLTIATDARSDLRLQQIAQQRGIDAADMASRLLRRTIGAAQPKPVDDVDALRNCVESLSGD